MLKADLKPLAPKQKLMHPALAAAAGTALTVGVSAAGGFVSRWMWSRYQAAKKKSKEAVLRKRCGAHVVVLDIETIEEQIIKTRRQIRVSLKRKG
jgi:hypothetical protein